MRRDPNKPRPSDPYAVHPYHLSCALGVRLLADVKGKTQRYGFKVLGYLPPRTRRKEEA